MKNNLCFVIVGVALMVSAAAVCGCSEKKPAYTEADVAAAGERVEALMTGFAAKGDVGDVDRLLDALRVAVAGTNELKSTGRLPFLGFLHNVFRANPGRVAGWTARAGEFGDSVVADVLKEAAGFDEEKFLAENAEPGMLDYCWGAFYATGDLKYVRKVVETALQKTDGRSVDLCQMAAAWSLHSFAVTNAAVAGCLNEGLKTAPDAAVKAIGEMFDEEDREKCFDAGVRMRMGLLAPAERKERPRPLLGRWKGLNDADDWIADVRTNRTIETGGSFRDDHLIPFIVEEAFPEGETNAEIRALAEDFAAWIWCYEDILYGRDISVKAKKLVDAGCTQPFVRWLSVLAPGVDRARVLDDMFPSQGVRCARTLTEALAAHSRWRERPGEESKALLAANLTSWAATRGFRDVKARCALHLMGWMGGTTCIPLMVEGLKKCENVDPWLWKVLAAVGEKESAWKSRGGGWANTVSEEGWKGYGSHRNEAQDLFDEVRRIHPDYPEGSIAEAQTCGGNLARLDALLSRITSHHLDEYQLYIDYAFFGLYPRWGGSVEKMEKFADICYATGRHDTMIPAVYAELQMEIAHEKGISLEEHFSDPVRIARFLEVCDAQVTNDNALLKVRNKAFYSRAVVLGRLGRYSEIGDFAKGRQYRKIPTWPKRLEQAIREDETLLEGLTGPHTAELSAAHALFGKADYRGFLSKVGKMDRGTLTENEKRYVSIYERSARAHDDGDRPVTVAADFADHREFSSPTPHWGVADRSYLYVYSRRGVKACNLQWRVPLPRLHEISFEFECCHTSRSDRATVWVDRRFCADTFSRTPSAFVCIDGNRVGASVDRDGKLATAKERTNWRPYAGGRVRVRIGWAEDRIDIWLGDGQEPCVSERIGGSGGCCCGPACRADDVRDSFFGSNVKIHDLKATVRSTNWARGNRPDLV